MVFRWLKMLNPPVGDPGSLQRGIPIEHRNSKESRATHSSAPDGLPESRPDRLERARTLPNECTGRKTHLQRSVVGRPVRARHPRTHRGRTVSLYTEYVRSGSSVAGIRTADRRPITHTPACSADHQRASESIPRESTCSARLRSGHSAHPNPSDSAARTPWDHKWDNVPPWLQCDAIRASSIRASSFQRVMPPDAPASLSRRPASPSKGHCIARGLQDIGNRVPCRARGMRLPPTRSRR